MRTTRFWIPLFATAGLGLVLTVAAVRGSFAESLAVDVRVMSVRDDYHVGVVTAATVQLTNDGNHPLKPEFSLVWEPQPAMWNVVQGPAELAPGMSVLYTIEASGPLSMPPAGTPFKVRVNSPGSIVFAVSNTVSLPKSKLSIVNPELRFWTEQGPLSPLAVPLGWQAYQHRDSDDKTSIEPVTEQGQRAARFHVVQDGRPDPGSWSHTGLTQSVPFPQVAWRVTVLSNAPYTTIQGGWPLTAFGVEVDDGRNGLLWMLFQPTGRGDLDYSLPSGHHIHVYDVPAGQWYQVRVDLGALYRQLGWTPPQRVTIKLFIAAASAEPNNIDGYIARIAPAPAPKP